MSHYSKCNVKKAMKIGVDNNLEKCNLINFKVPFESISLQNNNQHTFELFLTKNKINAKNFHRVRLLFSNASSYQIKFMTFNFTIILITNCN